MLKRKREPVFTTSEKHAILDLVEEHYHIVENKKSDATTIRSKNDEWEKIAIKFNANSSIHARDSSTLKMCWENLKKRVKQQQTQKNQHFMGTGGGPPKKFDDDPVAERVLSLIKSRITGYVNPFDSDGTHVLDESGSELMSQQLMDTTTTDGTFDWSNYTPSMLRQARNPVLGRTPSPSPDPIENQLTTPLRTHTQTCPARSLTPDSLTTIVDQQLSAPLRTHTQTRPAPSLSPDPLITIVDQQLPTPLRTHTQTRPGSSRRRPLLRHNVDTASRSLAQERINTLCMANEQAREQHDLQMQILRLQQQREQVMLEQEQVQLQILKFKLNKLRE